MKKITTRFFIVILAFSLVFIGCKKDKKEEPSKVQENGLTAEINNLVPDSILNTMVSLGMPVNGGATPPNIAASYLASPFILKESNVPSDYPGLTFANYRVTFYDQNNDNLSIKMNYLNGPESGTGLGGFIVGTNNSFTVFTEVNSTYSGYEASLVQVISGTLTPTGIEDFFYANFMLDNFGNPGGVWIANGEGCVIYDSDGFSEKVTVSKSDNSETGNGKGVSAR
ncbi:MAG: hypothetical protein FD170_3822 [Bacteroidetes bacterium]|nr:MAG: hypothetical protein FD170_3822 [Bacteroidota bacterium]